MVKAPHIEGNSDGRESGSQRKHKDSNEIFIEGEIRMFDIMNFIRNSKVMLLCFILQFFIGCASYSLHNALKTHDEQTARDLIYQGKSINSKDAGTWTPLMYTAQYNQLDLARLLIQQGAKADAKNNYGVTSLMIASRWGNLDMAEFLLDSGADINAVSKASWTALHYACRYGETEDDKKSEYIEIAKLLINRGANIDTKNNDGWTPLMFSCWYKKTDVSEILIQRGADVRAGNKFGGVPIHHAAAGCDVKILKLLYEKGAELKTVDDGHWNALMYACRYGSSEEGSQKDCRETAEFLIKEGVDISSRNDDGWIALMLASRYDKPEIVNILIKMGADIHAESQYGYTSLHLGASGGNLEVVDLLIKNGAKINSKIENDSAVRFQGRTALYMAAYKDHREVVKFLLEAGSDMDFDERDVHDVYAKGIVYLMNGERHENSSRKNAVENYQKAKSSFEEAEVQYQNKASEYRTGGNIGSLLMAVAAVGELAYTTKTGEKPLVSTEGIDWDTDNIERLVEQCELREEECRMLITECERRIQTEETAVTEKEEELPTEKENSFSNIKNIIDQYKESIVGNNLIAFYKKKCSLELFQDIKNKTEVMVQSYSGFDSFISDVSIEQAGDNKADVKFFQIITAVSKKEEVKQALFEGRVEWKLEKTGEEWKIIEVIFHPSSV